MLNKFRYSLNKDAVSVSPATSINEGPTNGFADIPSNSASPVSNSVVNDPVINEIIIQNRMLINYKAVLENQQITSSRSFL